MVIIHAIYIGHTVIGYTAIGYTVIGYTTIGYTAIGYSGASPAGSLYSSSWNQSRSRSIDSRSTPAGPHSDDNNPNNANNDNNDYVDDDLFGSAQWRKKRGTKRGSRTGREGSGHDKESATKNATRWAADHFLAERGDDLKTGLEVVGRRVGGVWGWVTSSPSPTPRESAAVPMTADEVSKTVVPEPGSYELTSEVLVQQARLQCGNYIYHRLSSKGLMSKRVHVAPHHSLLSEELCSAGQVLERLHPRVYSDVSRRIAMTMSSAQLVRRLLTSVLEVKFKVGVTWAKVVSMVVIAAAFAEECVVQGHPSFVEDVVMCVGHFVALHLTGWLAKQGGWAAFPTSRPPVLVKSSPRSPKLLNTTLFLFMAAIFALGIYKLFLCTT
ncbi:hypothetical protein ACOMHN_014587 [Nucella lapillus]